MFEIVSVHTVYFVRRKYFPHIIFFIHVFERECLQTNKHVVCLGLV